MEEILQIEIIEFMFNPSYIVYERIYRRKWSEIWENKYFFESIFSNLYLIHAGSAR